VQDEKRILKFVRHHHPPFPGRGESAVYALQYLASRDGRLAPSRMFVRQFLAFKIGFGAVVVDVQNFEAWAKKFARCKTLRFT
jgi:hypothetical protein